MGKPFPPMLARLLPPGPAPVLRSGGRVYLRHNPLLSGTVAHVTPVGFTITYDDPARKPGQPRSRFTYGWAAAISFQTGRPPAGED